jgi:trehalose-6-phosphate synthase
MNDDIVEIKQMMARLKRDMDNIHERLDRLEGLRQLFTAIEELQRYVADMDNVPAGLAFTLLRR